jgi:hypothetical protein
MVIWEVDKLTTTRTAHICHSRILPSCQKCQKSAPFQITRKVENFKSNAPAQTINPYPEPKQSNITQEHYGTNIAIPVYVSQRIFIHKISYRDVYFISDSNP